MAKASKRSVTILDARGNPIPHEEEEQQPTNVRQLPVETRPENLLGALIKAASDPHTQEGKLNALLDARDRLMKEQAEVEFTKHYVLMKKRLPWINKDGRIEIAAKSGASPTGRTSKAQSTPFSSYENIMKKVQPILDDHGFMVIMLPEPGPDNVGILMRGELSRVCETHYGDRVHTKRCAIPAPLETSGSKNNLQGVGSSLSYTKRYATITLLGIISYAEEDKDSDGVARETKRPKEKQPEPQVPKLSQDQLDKLHDAIEGNGVPLATFCGKYELKLWSELPPSLYEDAITACKTYGARKATK